jgi:hypothetical protein
MFASNTNISHHRESLDHFSWHYHMSCHVSVMVLVHEIWPI